MRFNLSEFFRTASAAAQGEIEGGIEAEQLQQQRRQQLAAQQMQQLQFLAGQQEQQLGRRERAATERLRLGSLVSPEERGAYYTAGINEENDLGNAPGIGADAFQGIGTPGWQPPNLGRRPPSFNPVAGTQQPGGRIPPTTAAASQPQTEPQAQPQVQPTPPSSGLQMPANLAGVGTTAPPPGNTGGPNPALIKAVRQAIPGWGLSPTMAAIFDAALPPNYEAAVQNQIAQTVPALTSGSGSPGPPATGSPGRLPSAGMAPPTATGHPGGMLAALTPPAVTATGLPNGVPPTQPTAPVAPRGPSTLDAYGQHFHLAEFDPQDIAVPWSQFQQLARTLPQYNLQGKDLTDAQAIIARHVRRPRTADELDTLGQDYSTLVGLVTGKSIQERREGLAEEGQWFKNLKIHGGAAYVSQLADNFRPEWGAIPLVGRDDFKKMKAKLAAGDTAGADQMAEQVQLSIQGGLTPQVENARMSMLFQAMAKIQPGSLSGHELLALANKYVPGKFTEADAPLMQRYLQGAAAAKQQEILLGQFKNWESIPPKERDNIIASINGMGKILGQQPINVDAKWVRDLTPEQRARLAQGDERLEMQGDRNDVIEAHIKFMEGLAQKKAAKGAAGTDQILQELIRKERVMNQAFERGLQTQKGGARSYVEWKRTNGPGTPGWETGPVDNPDDPDTAKAQFLWTLDHSAEALSGKVMDRIKQLGQQSQTPTPAGRSAGRGTPPPPARTAAPGVKPVEQMTEAEKAVERERLRKVMRATAAAAGIR